MANAAFLLLAVLATGATVIFSATATTGASPTLPARRSRFLLVVGTGRPRLPAYDDCSKKSAEGCLVLPGSAGTTCCGGQCVDIVASAEHCGGCNKTSKHGWKCCGGRYVDLLSDKKNCGSCSNRCHHKCNNGFCDYAQ